SLHMYQWFDGKYEVRILEYDVPIEVLQLIEDAMSHDLKPAFGKQGGNNK
ncbi:GIY-YIG nuclease family protein, partial [Vibrio parahaemolyticus]|nr:GIY-YIG nuclease family protein [Vibrio parahaemolyticus]